MVSMSFDMTAWFEGVSMTTCPGGSSWPLIEMGVDAAALLPIDWMKELIRLVGIIGCEGGGRRQKVNLCERSITDAMCFLGGAGHYTWGMRGRLYTLLWDGARSN